MATINRGLFPFLEGAFGKSRKALPEGMSEDGAIKPVAKAPSRWKNAITGGGAAEDAFDVNYRHMEREKNAGLQRELLNQRELGDDKRLTTAGEQAVTLEKLRAANDIKKIQSEIYEKAKPFHLAAQYPVSKFPDGAPLVIPETDRALVNLGRFGGKNLEEYGQENIGAYNSMQKQKLAQAENLSREEQKYIGEATRLKHEALSESVRGQVLGNDKARIDMVMPRKVDAGWNIDPTNGRWINVENATWGNEAVVTPLTRKTTLPSGKELVDTEEVVLNTMKKRGENEITPREQNPNEINPVEIANEENARRAEQRLRDMQKVAKERHNPTHDGSPQEEYKGSGGGGGLGTITGLVKKFMKLL